MKKGIEIINEMQMYKANNDFEGFEKYCGSLSMEEWWHVKSFAESLLNMANAALLKGAFLQAVKEVNQ